MEIFDLIEYTFWNWKLLTIKAYGFSILRKQIHV